MKNKRVLVIEDDEALSLVISHILSPRYEVIIMKNGMDAIAWLTNGNFPNLIMSDLHMPQVGGIELLQFLQHSGFLRDIPVIILSGDDNYELERQCKFHGAVKYLLKPFAPETIIDEVEDALKLSQIISY
jgi:CheY-like chemotaxis protein